MTVLQDLVGDAAGDTVPVTTLLRQLTIVARRTGAAPLADWVRHELEGYPAARTVPACRGPFPADVVGHLVGPMIQVDLPIPPRAYPPERRGAPLFEISLTEPVAELEHMSQATMPLYSRWTADTVLAYNIGVDRGEIKRTAVPGLRLASARTAVEPHLIAGVLDGVRTRILDLALDLEQVAPAAGQADAPAETAAAAQRVVINHFQNITGNVAIASDGITQSLTVHLPSRGDEGALLRYLGAQGVDPAQLVALREALEDDWADAGGQHPPTAGARVKDWLLRASTDLATNTAGGILAAAAPAAIAAAIQAFFGG